MAKSKKKAEQTQKPVGKMDIVQCVEHIVGEDVNLVGELGKGQFKRIQMALAEKGYTITLVKSESDDQQLLIIAPQGKPVFTAIVKEKGKVTFDPSESGQGKYQVVAIYEVSKNTAPAPVEPENEE